MGGREREGERGGEGGGEGGRGRGRGREREGEREGERGEEGGREREGEREGERESDKGGKGVLQETHTVRGTEDRLPETYPGGHPTRGEAGNLILKVDPTHSNYIHHVCRVVQGAVCVCVWR